MTDEQAVMFLQGIAVQAVELQALVEQMTEEDRASLRQVDDILDGLLEYIGANDVEEVFDSFSGRVEQRREDN